MRLFVIEENTKIANCKINVKDSILHIKLNFEVLKEKKYFEVEEILIDPIKDINNPNYIEIIKCLLKQMNIKSDNYQSLIEIFKNGGKYGFITDLEKQELMIANYEDVIVM